MAVVVFSLYIIAAAADRVEVAPPLLPSATDDALPAVPGDFVSPELACYATVDARSIELAENISSLPPLTTASSPAYRLLLR